MSARNVHHLFLTLFILVLAINSLVGVVADGEAQQRFLITVAEGYDCDVVAARINRQASTADIDWTGAVEKRHRLVRMLVVSGQRHTCNVVTDVEGVDFCEVDTVISIDD